MRPISDKNLRAWVVVYDLATVEIHITLPPGYRFPLVASLAKCLPVIDVPKLLMVAAVRFDVIDDGCRGRAAFGFTGDAHGMLSQIAASGTLPLCAVTAGQGVPSGLIACLLVCNP